MGTTLIVNGRTHRLSVDVRTTLLDVLRERLGLTGSKRRRSAASTAGWSRPNHENVPRGMPPDSVAKLCGGQLALSRGTQRTDVTAYALGAQFVEVRVHARTREVRVRRARSPAGASSIRAWRTASSWAA